MLRKGDLILISGKRVTVSVGETHGGCSRLKIALDAKDEIAFLGEFFKNVASMGAFLGSGFAGSE